MADAIEVPLSKRLNSPFLPAPLYLSLSGFHFHFVVHLAGWPVRRGR